MQTNLTCTSLLALLLSVGSAFGQLQAPSLIPFQAKLTDSKGAAIHDGIRLIQFQIYSEPVGGAAIWSGELHRTTVNGGLVNVMLGTKVPFAGVDFHQQLYLQITVDIDGDNAVTASDPPMQPRQSILPTVFAVEAGNSRKLAQHDWSAILENRESDPSIAKIAEAKLPSGIAVPVGAVVMWWGVKSEIPANFEICDGSLPTTPGASLRQRKPDMRGRFPRGASETQRDVSSLPIFGGSDRIEQRNSGATVLTASQIPAHKHPITDKPHSHGILRMVGGEGGPHEGILDRTFQTGNFGTRKWSAIANRYESHTSITTTEGNEGGGQGHDHLIESHDNRPAFLEMFFIIRVK